MEQQQTSQAPPIWTWSFMANTVICAACLILDGLIAWRDSLSSFFVGNFLVGLWVLISWVGVFQFRMRARQSFCENPDSALHLSEAPKRDGSPKLIFQSLFFESAKTTNATLLYSLMAVLLLLVRILIFPRR